MRGGAQRWVVRGERARREPTTDGLQRPMQNLVFSLRVFSDLPSTHIGISSAQWLLSTASTGRTAL
eukprot:6025646-Pleurochrysis_carterae.AAC.1